MSMKDRILTVLRGSSDFVSGEELSRELGVTRSAVWKSIKNLRSEGYIIDSQTNKGYRLSSCPDFLDAREITRGLEVSIAGTEVEVLREVDSTNSEAKRKAAQEAKSGLVIAADKQTAGKGRFGRSWDSGNGGLFFSLLIRPELPPGDIASITLAAGYAVCLAVRELTGLDAMIKWPNDIIIGRHKLCGILTEMSAQSDRLDYVVIGIGINVNVEKFPDELSEKATSLLIETGKRFDRNELLRRVITHLDRVLESFLFSVSLDDARDFKRLCATIGRHVSAQRGAEKLEGEAVDITASGELVVRSEDGREYCINSGEVAVQGIY